MKPSTLFSFAGIAALFFLGFNAADNKNLNDDNKQKLSPDKNKLSFDNDWYKQQAQRIKDAYKQLFSLAENRVTKNVVLQLKNNDDWKMLYNAFGTLKDGFRRIDLIFIIEQMNKKDRYTITSHLNKIGVKLFSNAKKIDICKRLKQYPNSQKAKQLLKKYNCK